MMEFLKSIAMLLWIFTSLLLLLLPKIGEGIWFLLFLERWIPSSLSKLKRKQLFGLDILLSHMGSQLWLLSLIVKSVFRLCLMLGSIRDKSSLLSWIFLVSWKVLFGGGSNRLGVVLIELLMFLLNGLSRSCLGIFWIFVLAPKILLPYVMRTPCILLINNLLLLKKKEKINKYGL